jgi:alkylation response protein AidB-like acyl-CoA dehydrogenase
VDLDLTDTQLMLKSSLRDMLSDKSPPQVVRQMEGDPTGFPEELWTAMVDMGLPGLNIDPAFGGLGMGAIETTIVYEEFGRALAPSPHFSTSVLAGNMIASAGNEDQRRTWLQAIAEGREIQTIAWLEPGGSFSSTGVQLRGTRNGDDVVLNGKKYLVPFAKSANTLLVLARSGDQNDAIDLIAVDAHTDGVSMVAQETMASDSHYVVTFKDVVVPISSLIGSPGTGWESWQKALSFGMIALASWAVGCADRANELAVEYSKERIQFDRPIGGFQAVAHPLTNAATMVTGSRLMAQEAAWSFDSGRPHERLAMMAFLHATETARQSTKSGHQTFGGIGFTVDIDMQLYYRRAKQCQLAWGDRFDLEEAIGSDVIGKGTI